jgi:hypothetical protein
MVIDHYGDEWRRRYWPMGPSPFVPTVPVQPVFPLPTQQELDEFRRLLDRAREYDKRNNEPDCEMDEKKKLLKEMADKLGVDISFIDGATT